MSETLATLKPAQGPAHSVTTVTGDVSVTACSAPDLADGSDATSFQVSIAGDGFSDPGVGQVMLWLRFEDYVGTGATVETVRLRVRCQRHSTDGTALIQPVANQTAYLSGEAGSLSMDWLDFDFTTQPGGATPWDEGAISGFMWGALVDVMGVDPIGANGFTIADFELLVIGEPASVAAITYGSVRLDADKALSSITGPVTVLDGQSVTPVNPGTPDYIQLPDPQPSDYRLSPYNPARYAKILGGVEAKKKLAATALRSKSAVNLCAVQEVPGSWAFAETDIDVLAAIEKLPEQKASPDEIHSWFTVFALYETTWRELARFGVTPSGRIGAFVAKYPDFADPTELTLLSGTGAAIPDKAFRNYSLRLDAEEGGNFGVGIYVDGVLLVHTSVGIFDAGQGSPSQLRAMLFNSLDGLTHFDFSLALARFQLVDADLIAEMFEGEGDTISFRRYEGHVLEEAAPTEDLKIRALAQNEFGQALVWGSASEGSITWSRRPGFLPRNPTRPTFRPRISPAPSV